ARPPLATLFPYTTLFRSERGEAVDVDAPHRCRLGGRPELAELAASLPGDVDRQVRHRAPEVDERGAAVREALVVDVDRAVHGDEIGRASCRGRRSFGRSE